uniref:Mon2/Sec7/BIG1-like HDS domain-containing protein n=1 Tax=Physcomitrium patens TaxID=3218 RepID=A0A2K1KWZ3_PHYPA|nr:hypothetical protein PHYPA_005293 [Physcomitrium patens]
MRSNKNPSIKALIVGYIIQMIKSKVESIKSGWRSVLMVFTTAAYDGVVSVSVVAFENVELAVLEHFDQVVENCFMDCINCLIAFASNKINPQTSLKAIALLQICEDRLEDDQIAGGVLKSVSYGDGLQPSHKRLVMDTLLSMVDFVASCNNDSNLQSRMQSVFGDRPPPNLLH